MSQEISKGDELDGGKEEEELREAAAGGGGGGDDDDEGTRQPYNCTFCRRGFPTAQALGGHMNVHRKDRGAGRAATPTTTTTKTASASAAAARRSVSYDTLVGLLGQSTRPASGGGGSEEASTAAAGGRSLSRAEWGAPQELRLFGRDDDCADRREEGGGCRDRREHDDRRSKDDGDDDDLQGEEELDLELRLGGSGS